MFIERNRHLLEAPLDTTVQSYPDLLRVLDQHRARRGLTMLELDGRTGLPRDMPRNFGPLSFGFDFQALDVRLQVVPADE